MTCDSCRGKCYNTLLRKLKFVEIGYNPDVCLPAHLDIKPPQRSAIVLLVPQTKGDCQRR